MTPGCLRTGFLLERRAAGLSAADALRLEEHLTRCERCAQEASLLGGLFELAREAPVARSPGRRTQVVTRALAATAGAASRKRVPARWVLPALAAAAAGALAVLAGSLWHGPEEVVTQAPPALPAPALPIDRVLGGELTQDGRALEAGAALGSSTLYSARGATVTLGHARIELRPGTEAAWEADGRVLRLRAGSVRADVDPTRHASFTVSTASFSVLVLGTRFEVTPESVHVEHGRVRVVGAGGHVLAPNLGAGEHFQLKTASAATAPAPRSQKALRINVDELLARARGELAQHHLEHARAAIDQALRSAVGRSERAEALSLRAECALMSGDLGGAAETYLKVARRFSNLPAGQNALFAAARIEADRGHSEQAAALLERYLARYPRGHMVGEARSRLRSLHVD